MDESDTAAILPGDVLASVTEEKPTNGTCLPRGEGEEESGVPATRTRKGTCSVPVSVEPVMFLSMFSLVLQVPLATQYLWDRISEDLGFNGTKTSECHNSSVPPDPLLKEVETLTAHWNMYINLGGFFVALFVVPLLGSWSDAAGRRPVLIIPNLGLALNAAVFLVVMYLKLPVACFLVGRLLSGFLGDFNAILAACFSYVSDISDRKSRTFRVAVLEACVGIAGMLASIIGGQWSRVQGYINPFWLVLATSLASALYALLFVRESVVPDPRARLLTLRHYKTVWHLFSTGGSSSEAGGQYHRCKLWLYMLCFFLLLVVHFGCRELYVLYELSAPLCWDSNLIGYGSATLHVAFLTSLAGLRLMQLCLEDSWVALVGLVSNIGAMLVFAFAVTTELVFTGYAVGFLSMAVTPVIRSKLSKMVDPSEQGALFAAVACVEALCILVATSLYNSLFPATLPFMKGFTFLFSAGILFIPAGIIGSLQISDKRREATAS